ncbi:MAG: hypothetical protein PHH13_03695 [Candidatus Peribacteraceae bacterium]|nr:hypothetical protein [Candidatus Peribacteraceae bacterium]
MTMTNGSGVSGDVGIRSEVIALYPLVRCLKAAEAELGGNRVWATTTPEQEIFYPFYVWGEKQRSHAFLPEAECIATRNMAAYRQFVQQRSFRGVEVPAAFTPGGLGIASVFRLAPRCKHAATPTCIKGYHCGMYLEGVHVFRTVGSAKFVAELETEQGDRIYLSPLPDALPKELPNGFAIADFVDGVHHGLKAFEPSSIIVPAVDFVDVTDFRWMQGMHTVDAEELPAVIEAAVGKVDFQMTFPERAVSPGQNLPDPDVVFDGPFVLWVERRDIHNPLLISVIAQDSWRKRPCAD